MAALPYMQLYVAEYLADTCHLNAAQHGAYLLLLMNYWQRGKPLPDLNDRLAIVARMSNEEWTANREVIAEFFQIEDGMWIHDRVERDLEKVKGISDAGRTAGLASAEARRQRAFNDRSTDVPTELQRDGNQQNRLKQKKILRFFGSTRFIPIRLEKVPQSRKSKKHSYSCEKGMSLTLRNFLWRE